MGAPLEELVAEYRDLREKDSLAFALKVRDFALDAGVPQKDHTHYHKQLQELISTIKRAEQFEEGDFRVEFLKNHYFPSAGSSTFNSTAHFLAGEAEVEAVTIDNDYFLEAIKSGHVNFFIDFLSKASEGTLEMKDVMLTINPETDLFKDYNGHAPTPMFQTILPTINGIVAEHMHDRYWGEVKDPDFDKFIEWYKGRMLDIWSRHGATYNMEHYDFSDRSHIEYVWLTNIIRKGEVRMFGCYAHTPFPAAMKCLVQDGLIRESEVFPPLREIYKTKTEKEAIKGYSTITENPGIENALVGAEPIDLNHLCSEVKRLANESTSSEIISDEGNMSPGKTEASSQTNSDSVLDGSLVLHENKEYIPLIVGKNVAFVYNVEQYPNGDKKVGDVLKLSRTLESQVKTSDTTLTIDNSIFKIEFYDRWGCSLDEYLETGKLPASYYKFKTQIPVDEFMEKYHSDIGALAIMTTLEIETPAEFQGRYRSFVGYEGKNVSLGFSKTAKLLIRTEPKGVELEIIPHKYGLVEDIIKIGSEIRGYLENMGIAFTEEATLTDEFAYPVAVGVEKKALIPSLKKELEEISQTENHAKVLSSFIASKKYRIDHFGIADTPCDWCQEQTYRGQIFTNTRHQGPLEAIYLTTIHDLFNHPDTIKSSDSIFKLYIAIKDLEPYTPLFIECPEILPTFKDFSVNLERQQEIIDTYEVSCDFMGIPKLHRFEGPNEIKEELSTLISEGFNLGGRLTREYNQYSPHQRIPDNSDSYFWEEQLVHLQIYKSLAPGLLNDDTMAIPTKVFTLENPSLPE